MKTTHRLSNPAPARCWSETSSGKYSSHPWTVSEVKEVRSGGGWFAKGKHDFANREAALEAGVSGE